MERYPGSVIGAPALYAEGIKFPTLESPGRKISVQDSWDRVVNIGIK